MRTNPVTGHCSGYYRLVESYRNQNDRVCHRTLLNAGFLDELNAEQLNAIQKILTHKIKNPGQELFDLSFTNDSTVCSYVKRFYDQLVIGEKIDLGEAKPATKHNRNSNIQTIYVDSLRNKDVREIGAEWLTYQAFNQLGLARFLTDQGWSEQEVKLAQTHIISRAVYPASELETTRWIKENSAICELTGYDISKISKDKLYNITKKLFEHKTSLEQYLAIRTNELFDIQDTIMLYDLTNTYFEGRKQNSQLSKFGRSKEKRSDAKLVVLALVVNPEGFIKYSSIHQGNMSDSKTLGDMVTNMRIQTSATAQKALVVIDAGIATDENLKMLKSTGFDYLCVSRANLNKYTVEQDTSIISVKDNRNQKIELCRAHVKDSEDYYLKVHSHAKEQKERSMNDQFKERFELELQKISDSLQKKGGTKLADKVHERIGRARQKYPSIQKYFQIDVQVEETPSSSTEKKTKLPKRVAKTVTWSIKENTEVNARSGIYFLRTSLDTKSEQTLWKCYNTIREIEATFRVLKTDLDLRPIYHQKDDATMAHLHLGILAYWLVNTIRYQLKQHGINSGWREIVRIMNTQKAVTTTAQNVQNEIIQIRKCSDPNQNVKGLYDALKFKHVPFTKRKFVVHKMEIKKTQLANYEGVHPN